MPQKIGKALGKYEVYGFLGAGGMADVYKGFDTGLSRPVAIKVLKPERSQDPGLVEAFANEARTAARLKHPHIVTIHDIGQRNGLHYIVMEYVAGDSLQQRIDQQGPLQPRRVCELFDQIADALHHAHRQGYVHCDVKPSNVLLEADGRVKLSDFGLARAVAQARSGKWRKRIGSPRYMSPEHVMGKPVDHLSDIYSLGMVLYEMLTGRIPFRGQSSEVMRAHVTQRPPPPSSINPQLPKEVDRVVLRALAKNPRARYPNALQMARDLRTALSGRPQPPPPAPPGPQDELVSATPPRRFPWPALGLTVAALLLVAAAVVFGPRILQQLQATPTPTPTLRATSTATQVPTARATVEVLAPTATSTRTLAPTSTLEPTSTVEGATRTPVPTPVPPGPARITQANAQRVTLLRELVGHWGWVGSAVFSPDGTTLASASGDTTVRLWRVGDGALLRTLEGHSDEVYSVAFSPDGATLASGAIDHTVRLWRVSDGAFLCSLYVGDNAWARVLAFDTSGRFVAGDSAEVARVWEVATCRLSRTIQGDAGTCVAFSPDGNLLASGSQFQGQVRIVRMSDGWIIRTLAGHSDPVYALAFSRDGQTLASGAGSEIRIWRVSDGQLLAAVRGHEGSVNALAFSPNGEVLASGSHDHMVKLWRVADGALLATLAGHTHEVNGVSFSPDGALLVSASGDGTLRLWGLSAE